MESTDEQLMKAAAGGDDELVAVLLNRGANINFRDDDSETPLYKASENGKLETVKLLLLHGAKVDTKQWNGRTSLSAASANGHLEIVKELLRCGGAIENTDRDGLNALYWGSRNGHCGIVQELLMHGAATNTRDTDGKSPLHWATKHGDLDIVKQLLEHGASVNTRDKDGRTPLNDASGQGHGEIVKTLLEHNAPVNNKSWDGSTALYDALWQGHSDIAKVLLEHGASVDIADVHGRTCLHVASISKKGQVDIVKELLTRSAEVNAVDKYGNSPLHSASSKGHMEVLKVLLNAGAKTDIKNKDGRTAPDLGNHLVKTIFENHRISNALMNNEMAALQVEQALYKSWTRKSAITEMVTSILQYSVQIHVQRQNVLTIGVMVQCIAEDIQVYGSRDQEPALRLILGNIERYYEKMLRLGNSRNLNLENLQNMTTSLLYFQTRLVDVANSLFLPLNCRVQANFDDIRNDIGNAINKIYDIDRYLNVCMCEPDLQHQMDLLTEMAISIQRTLEYYNRQVAWGNIVEAIEFENQLRFCQDKIANTIGALYQSKGISNFLPQIESWMLSSHDVQFDSNDMSTLVGRGGFAIVFKGEYQGQTVAVKRFDQILGSDTSYLEEMIHLEIECWKDISHEPYILTLIGACTKISTPILVTEMCQTNIRRFVRDRPEMLLPMVYQFACGLTSIHNANIIHRDIKGDNVLVTFQETAAIADFGLSRTVSSLETSKTGNKLEGTLYWMSPEQFFKPRNVTTKSDIWSFGMTVWEVLCNDIPFRGCSEAEFAHEIFQSEEDRPEKPRYLNPQLEPLWILITKCWQLDPAARPTASDIVDFLQTHYGDQLTSQEDASPLPVVEDLDQFQLFNVESNEFIVPEETIESVTSLKELVKLLLASPAKTWPLFRNFILYPDEIESSNRPTFRAGNDRQPQKRFIIQLSDKRRDLDLIESCLDDEKRCHLVVECVDWGEWNVAGYMCYVIIMERDSKNMSLFSPNRQTQPTALSTQSEDSFPPCLWKLHGVTTHPLPRGKMLHKISLRLLFCCEVRDDSCCEYFPHDDLIQVEARSRFIREALPILKMSFLLLKALAMISDYDICIGPDYNFDVRNGAPDERLLKALEAIHGQVDTPQRLNEIVDELESGDLNDDQVEIYANEIYQIIDDHRERNRIEMLNLLHRAGLSFQGNVISGLKKHALVSRYVCKKHFELVEDGVLNLRRDPPLHLDTSSVLSLSFAAKYILKTLENIVDSTSEIVVTARAIFDLALKCEVYRQSVLATALMVERIVRQVQALEGLEHPPTLIEALSDVEDHFKTIFIATNMSKLLFVNTIQQSKFPAVTSNIDQLQDRLVVAVEYLNIDLTLSVEGHIEDLQQPIGNLIDKMNSIDKSLEMIGEQPNQRRRKDKLIELAIQTQRGFEFYQRQVVLGNIPTLHDFENQIQLIRNKIHNVVDRLKAGEHLPKAFSLDKIEPWMLSSDDVTFNSNDLATFLGRGTFATVYKGMYQGQPVAVKVFEQILQTDSADLERFIAKEMSAWKGISHEPYILTLVGVCTKVPTPILVCELCQANIRNYVKEKPYSLIPLVYQVACGLASLHQAKIIHRDIKGDNILITFRETVAISDFGMNRVVMSIENTKTRVAWTGKLNWTSPELYLKPRRATEKSDVWSFGMTLWEVICKAVPFEGCDENKFRNDIYKSENVRPQKPDNLNPEHEPLWALMTMCWQLDPNARPSADEIVKFVENHFNAYL